MSVSYETCAKTDKEIFQNECFVRDIFANTDTEIFQNDRFVRDIRKNGQRDLAKWAFRTRHSQKLTKRPSKMSVSYETFPKTKISAFQCPNGTACISHIRHARSPQRVDHAQRVMQFRLGFAHPTRTIPAEGWPRSRTNAVSPRFRASDTHDPRRGLHTHPHKRSFTSFFQKNLLYVDLFTPPSFWKTLRSDALGKN